MRRTKPKFPSAGKGRDDKGRARLRLRSPLRTVASRYRRKPASAASTRARIGVRLASVRCFKRGRALFLGLVKQAENHLHPADNEALRDQTAFRCLASSIALIGSGCHLETPN